MSNENSKDKTEIIKNLEEIRTRTRDSLAKCNLTRGIYIWGKFNHVYWPGIIINAEEIGLKQHPNHCMVFWFGDYKISQILNTKIVDFAKNFRMIYKARKQSLWLEAVTECILFYGFPFTANMDNDLLIDFGLNRMHKLDLGVEDFIDLPEFVKVKLYARKLLQVAIQNKTKKLKEFNSDLHKVIDSLCISCLGEIKKDYVIHPLFDCKICVECSQKLKKTLYQIEYNGEYEYCFICGNAKNYQCKNTKCHATYCNFCIKNIWGLNSKKNIKQCILCSNLYSTIIKPSYQIKHKICSFLLSSQDQLISKKIITPCKLAKFDIGHGNNFKIISLFYGSSIAMETIFPLPYNFLLTNACNNIQEKAVNKVQTVHQYFDNRFVKLVRFTLDPTMKTIKSDNMHIEQLHRLKCLEIGEVLFILGGTNIIKNKLHKFRQNSYTDLCAELFRVVTLYKEEINKQVKWIFEVPSTVSMEDVEFMIRYFRREPIIIGDSEYNYCLVWTNLFIEQKNDFKFYKY